MTQTQPFHETLPPRLVELVRQAKDQIAAAPYAFQMPHCAQRSAICGTALCVLGHMAVLDSPKLLRDYDPSDRSGLEFLNGDIVMWRMRIYELQDEAWSRLFLSAQWPKRFLPASPDSALARIDYWLETGK